MLKKIILIWGIGGSSMTAPSPSVPEEDDFVIAKGESNLRVEVAQEYRLTFNQTTKNLKKCCDSLVKRGYSEEALVQWKIAIQQDQLQYLSYEIPWEAYSIATSSLVRDFGKERKACILFLEYSLSLAKQKRKTNMTALADLAQNYQNLIPIEDYKTISIPTSAYINKNTYLVYCKKAINYYDIGLTIPEDQMINLVTPIQKNQKEYFRERLNWARTIKKIINNS